MIKYIFSINPGRSGSQYLSKLLSCFDYISSHHEPNPVGNGKPMLDFNNGDESKMKNLVQEKREWIELNLKNEKYIYAETNHTFIKGFGWLLVNEIPLHEIGIIILNRDENQIIKSLMRIDTTPLNESGRVWLLSPNAKKNEIVYSKLGLYWFKLLFRINGKWPNNLFFKVIIKRMEIYYLKWYLDEQKAREKVFKETFPSIRFFETDIEKLNSQDELKKMFKVFEIPYSPSPRLYELLGKPANLKIE
jgi:hypothetical protein